MAEGCLTADEVDAMLAGTLAATAVARAEEHIDGCADCRVLVGQLARDSAYAIAHDQTVAPSKPSKEEIESGETIAGDSGDATKREGPAMRPSVRLADKIDRYVIDKKLGAGGMGIVYLAEDPELKRKVVLKLLRPELDTGGPDRARLLREAQAMAKVSHGNVVPIYDVGVHNDQVFLAMEFIDGVDLATWLKEERPQRAILDTFVAAGRGLAAAHKAGLVHRDFKPHNVLIGNDGAVKVTDFGLARVELAPVEEKPDDKKRPRVVARDVADLSSATLLESPLTMTGALVGTPAYMAPEQIRGEVVDARTDQFSFCIALYEALYKQRPFTGKTANELFESTLEGKLPPAFGTTRGVPRHVRDAIRRGLRVEPAERHPSMDALIGEIAPRSRRSLAIAAVAGLATVAAAGVTMYALRGGNDAPAPCSGPDELASVWNPARRQAIEAAFTSTGQPVARAAFASIAGDIDRYAEEWHAGFRDACMATRVRATQSEQVMDERMRCLHRRGAELDALLDVVAHPDDAVLTNASSLASNLTSPASCANLESLAATPPPPDPKLRAEVEAIEAGVAKERAQAAATRIDVARKQATDLLARARSTGHKPLVAELLLEVGQTHILTLDYQEAEKYMNEAVEVAELAGADYSRATAYVQLVAICTALGRFDDAERWVRHARAAVERVSQDKALSAELDRNVGELFKQRGDQKAAEASLQRALERLSALHGPDSRDAAIAHRDLGSLYQDMHDYERSFAEHGKAKEIFAKVLGPENPEVASSIGLQSGIRRDQGKIDEAITLGEQELELMRRYYGDDHYMLAPTYQGLALVLQQAGRNDEAIAMMKRSAAITEKAHGTDSALHAGVLATLGLLYFNTNHPDDGYDAFARALAIYRKAYGTDTHTDIVTTLNAMATVRKRQQRYAEALALLEQSRAIVEKVQASGDGQLHADTLTRIGTVQILRDKPADAIPVLEKALEMRMAAKAAPSLVSWTRFELAKALWNARRDRTRALTLAQDAAKEAEADADQSQLADVTKWLADKHL